MENTPHTLTHTANLLLMPESVKDGKRWKVKRKTGKINHSARVRVALVAFFFRGLPYRGNRS